MNLFYRKYGSGQKTIVILHGLYGSSDNWITFGKKLSADYEVHIPDQRNHGNSPHHMQHSYYSMRDDLLLFFQENHISKAILIGHSMGGKTAVSFASKYPDMVEKLVILDVTPRNYRIAASIPEHILMHKKTIQYLLALPLEKITSRSHADKLLSEHIPSKKLRQFLLKNLKHESGKYKWKINLAAIAENLENILHNECLLDGKPVKTETLFVRGARSEYLKPQDLPFIRKEFQNVSFETIQDAGHWLHAEQPEKLFDIINQFCQ